MNYELRIRNYKILLNCCIVIIFFCFFVFLFSANYCYSEGLVPAPTGGGGEGDYTLNDFVTVFVNLAAWILGITGSLALLFFIYGGVMFLISGGSSERVQQAKQIIIGSIIGVVIVLTSFMIINFMITSLTGSSKINGKEWFQLF